MPSLGMPSLRNLVALAALLITGSVASAQGPILSGAGPINRSMGGASVAAPLDATGTLYWNPAAISGLKSSELDLGLELLYPHSQTSSAVPGGALGPNGPRGSFYGYTRDEAGVFPLPTGGFVFKPCDSGWTFGLGLFPAAGFGTNYPGGAGNPILTPAPPAGAGLGHVSSDYQVLQIAPTVAYQLTERLSFGFAPVINMARLSVTPGSFLGPNDANGDGFGSYSSATSTRFAWGGGFQAGLYFTANEDWSFGASFKSPMWFEPFRYQISDELGRSHNAQVQFDMPMIVSLGTAYTGIDKLTIAADIRYFNYRNTSGYRNAGFNPDGSTQGLGWNDVFSAALGAQYQLTDKISMRMGYTYNTNPIPGANATFNVASPLTYQHQLAAGASYQLSTNCVLSATYYHIFYSTITGPYLTPFGAVPGASVSTGAGADSLLVGISVKF